MRGHSGPTATQQSLLLRVIPTASRVHHGRGTGVVEADLLCLRTCCVHAANIMRRVYPSRGTPPPGHLVPEMGTEWGRNGDRGLGRLARQAARSAYYA